VKRHVGVHADLLAAPRFQLTGVIGRGEGIFKTNLVIGSSGYLAI